ncbi:MULTISPECIES: DUF2790 domain-containing protein [Pseudomonas]|uniref:DUF2790 domain-containing protein n=1 Tax=Pseudomonas TaxID=286 RepID=UPI00069E7804|nr:MULTISPECIES: DUF2790 domain-containing protein [Pseudomonas]MCE0463284.1 DUF2790 domain-containing protein [Pseudomonas uvaldensis]MCG6576771.1 DUF2790 domain-containing protein [Pseudomonas sp. AF32]
MNIRNVSTASLLAVIALSNPSLFAKEQTQDPAYEYGMPLDIARVIRIEAPAPQTCEVVRAKMTYVNTQGVIERVSFLQLAEACAIQ